ncbi:MULTISPECIES: ribonuclease T [Hahella]|uniref:Ribonuclease T n=1 Tax=Hahella chejuensis (strain KCTC 2396) TaxID=349521 RepID=RNT_HAHCH|nr:MULTISPECIES: ribonuclease T [Hahella]Q2SCE2.1 RecName: Full=Ribonuclease T; AltName: Full=Exoribonuclease T; Short=RNase T [Hahella chejuensis KCTC 2396]MBU6952432.1 ribonuclease T [Hahella sp. HN01]ABC31682.1 ribonuclease T [Hahella chejuensis KCTC 2396]MDG9668496.1 ribonuclease T [Hahella sp. CR1]WLQ14866.1 ribonuclease T [Hahella sp. HNIBRBA332]
MSESQNRPKSPLARRFRGFLPVVVDVETAGFNSKTDALLEVSAVIISMEDDGMLYPEPPVSFNVEPFAGANIEQAALEFTGIDPFNPLRDAKPEADALNELFRPIRKSVKSNGCNRAILVGHNATFDHSFLFAAAERGDVKRNPFHPFSTFDTATLAALAYGHTVLSRACQLAGIPFDNKEAHSAEYDAMKTAELFCSIVNRWKELGGWTTDQQDYAD